MNMVLRSHILGSMDQESDDISGLFIELYPDRPLPAFIACMATPRGVRGTRQCKHVVCSRCHATRQANLGKRLFTTLEAGGNAHAGMHFITLTVPHTAEDSLVEIMAIARGAWKFACSGPAYKTLRQEYGLWGTVRVPELSYGQNGWNYHLHVILFASDLDNATHCSDVIKERYKNSLRKNGRNPTNITVDAKAVYDCTWLPEYLSKNWKNASDGDAPLDLLLRAKQGDKAAALLFFQVASALEHIKRGFVHSSLAKKLREAGERRRTPKDKRFHPSERGTDQN